jgi:hypothetical protein
MTNASARACAVSSAVLLLGFAAPQAWASDRLRSTATVSIQGSAAVTIVNTVVNNAPLQTLLLTIAIAPVNVVFAAPGASTAVGSVSVGAAGGGTGSAGLVSPSSAAAAGNEGSPGTPGDGAGGGAAELAGAGLPADDGGPPALIVIGGALTGTTIDGDAVSVSVSDVSGGSTADSARVPMVIAQYN